MKNELKNYELHLINETAKLKDALEQIGLLPFGNPLVLFVTDKNFYIKGSISDGDIRRGLLKNCDLNSSVKEFMKSKFYYIKNLNNYEKIKRLKELDIRLIPHITEEKKLINFIDLTKTRAILPVDVVIMAGGKGVRLKPYTKDIPKPMLELENKPIIAHNIDRLISYGIKNFYICVNHLKEQIISYVSKNYENINVEFVEEEKQLGTIGAVSLIKKFEYKDVMVINADILTNIDFEDFYANYKKMNSDMSVATFNIKVDIPYAVLETENRKIKSFIEKPTYTYYSNAGIYLFKKEHIKFINKNESFDAIELIEQMIKSRKIVNHFAICGYWLDIGTVQNYSKAQNDIKYIKF